MFASGEIARAALALGDLEIVCPVCGTDCVISSTSEAAADGHQDWPIGCVIARSQAVSRAIHRTCPGGSRLTDCVRQVCTMLIPIVTCALVELDFLVVPSVVKAFHVVYKAWVAMSDVMCWELYGRPAYVFAWGGVQSTDAQTASPWRLHEMRYAAEDLGMPSLRYLNPLKAESMWMLAVSEDEACRFGAVLYARAITEELPWDRCVQTASDVLLDLRREMKAHYDGQWGKSMSVGLWTDRGSCHEPPVAGLQQSSYYMSSVESALGALVTADQVYRTLVACKPAVHGSGGANLL